MGELAAMQQAFWTYLHGARQAPDADLLAHTRSTAAASAAARLRIYHAMYARRLLLALQADFPKLAAWLGEPAFAEVATGYVRACPSRDPDIGRLGDGLAEYLHVRAQDGAATPRAWADMAAFESARRAVFFAADAQPDGAQVLSQFDSEEMAQVCLRPVPALRLVRAEYDVVSIWERLDAAESGANTEQTTTAHAKSADARERLATPCGSLNARERLATPCGSLNARERLAAPRAWAVWCRDEQILHAALSPEEARAVAQFLTGASLAEICQVFADTADPIQAAFSIIGTWFHDGWVLSATLGS